MKLFNHFLLNLILFVSVFFTIFSISFSSGFCTDIGLTLDSSSASMLSNGAGGDLASFSFNAGGDILVYGVDQIITDINTKLYDSYGWDLETVSWEVEDAFTDAVKTQVNEKLAAGATIGQFAKVYATNAYNSTWGKLFTLAEENSQTGKLEVVSDNMYVKVHQGLLDNYLAVRNELVSDGDITNLSLNQKPLYAKDVNFIDGNKKIILQFDKPCWFYSNSISSSVHIVYSGSNPVLLGGVFLYNNNPYPISSYTQANGGSFSLGGVTYYDYYLLINSSYSHNYQVTTGYMLGGDRNVLQNFISTTLDKSYSYKLQYGNYLDQLLSQLDGHYVTTKDLASLRDLILDLPVNVVEDQTTGEKVGVIDDSYADTLSRLEALVLELVEESEVTDEGLNGGNNNNNNGDDQEIITQIPTAYWPSFFPELLPEGMFSMFQPIFDIVGSTYSMYGLWILIPSILIFILVLYIIVSLL